MQSNQEISLRCANQIGMLPFIEAAEAVLVEKNVPTPFGQEKRWFLLDKQNGQEKSVKLKPSAVLGGKSVQGGEKGFYYYQERYPQRCLYQLSSQNGESEKIVDIEGNLGSFQVSGDWLAWAMEPAAGSREQVEEFHFYNMQTGQQEVLRSPGVSGGRLPVVRHQQWHFAQEKLFFPGSSLWRDADGNSLQQNILCYDVGSQCLRTVGEMPENFVVQAMRWQDGMLWILGSIGQEMVLEEWQEQEPAILSEKLRISQHSYEQLMEIQVTPQGLFWLKKEIHSLLENESTLWKFDWIQQEAVLMQRLSDFRALTIRLQPVGQWLYYQDEFWKVPCRTPLDAPMTQEKVLPETDDAKK